MSEMLQRLDLFVLHDVVMIMLVLVNIIIGAIGVVDCLLM